MPEGEGVKSRMESHSSFHGDHWTPQRAAFHNNLELFAERIGLIVALQSNGKKAKKNLTLRSEIYGKL